ncbi:WD40-repeat-containing domain protein [Umbelopsis sp. PMI_123]|nr:WD40-repeat-containing domain protein [Umbelopsis sp. PMI_123]
MLICKPDWITHTDSSQNAKEKKVCIYSVHVHPNGERLATGGLDTKVRIWNTAPVLNEEAEEDPNCHKLLCTMTMHNGAVLCVRWSNVEGRYLASGSDNDNTIIIWELDRSVTRGTVFGSSDVNYESWRPVKYLRGHESDVQDLAWSSDNQYLASCAVDGHVIVWDGLTFDRVKKIDQHGGFVKGVTWDPVGKYLASQSDDNLVKIWRTSDWSLERDIREPFVNAPGTTFFRRLSWAPNGSHIAAANAVNGMQCVAAVISRDNWSSDLSLVGHELPVEVACFNPKLFYFNSIDSDSSAQPADEQRGTLASVCALGGQDRSISIWVTKHSRPLCVATDVFQNNIYDLAWSPDGRYVVACSQDGTVAFLQLDEELGTPIEDDEMIQLLSKYGYKRKAVTLPEAPEQLELEEEIATSQKASASSRIVQLMGGNQPDTTMTDITQVEKLTDKAEDVNSTTKSSRENESPTSTSPTTTIPNTQKPTQPSAVNNITKSVTEKTPTPSMDVAKQQQVTIGKDGKKRIRPVFVTSGNSIHNSLDTNKSQANDEATKHHSDENGVRTNGNVHGTEYDSPSSYLPSSGIPTSVVGTKRKPNEEISEQDSVKRVDIDQNSSSEPLYRPSWIDSAIVPPIVRQSQLRLGVPKVKSVLTHRGHPHEPSWVLECQNSSNRDHSKVIYCNKGSPVWVDYVPSSVLQMTGNKHFCAVGCEDGSIVIYSPAGRRLLPPLMLESTPVWMSCSDRWLLALTATGLLYIWDVINETSFLSEISVAPVLQVATVVPTADHTANPAPTIKDIRIQKNGTPIIITNHSQAFAYHLNMKIWTRICDAWQMLSELWGSGSQNMDAATHPLGWLSRATTTVGHKASSIGHHAKTLARMDHQATSIITLGHIETQLAVAVLLDSPDEYRQWMMYYAKRLATENATERVEELCRWLLGPTYLANDSQSQILGTLDKRGLLKTILPILSQNRQLQRIVAEHRAILQSNH